MKARVEELVLRYRLPRDAPQAGDRFPWLRLRFQANAAVEDLFQRLTDTRLSLLVFGQSWRPDAAPELAELLNVHVIPADPENDAALARARIPGTSFYLLRPDGHVGLCGLRLEAAAITAYVRERLQLEAA